MNRKALITILTYNSAAVIADCLASLKKITYPVSDFKVLVIDNASTDNTLEIIKQQFSDVTVVVNEKNLGFAAGNNIGFEYAKKNNFDYIYLLNDDTEVEPDFLEKAISVMQSDDKAAAVQSKILLHKDKTKINSIGNELHFMGFGFTGGYQQQDFDMSVKEITYPSGAGVLFDMTKLQEVGYFDPDFFMYHEDTDIGWRIWLLGYKCLLAPTSVIYHKYEFKKSIKKFYYMERNRYLVVLYNYKLATILLIYPAMALMDLAMFFYSFIAGWWREELRVSGYFFKASSWKKVFAKRKEIQQKRKKSDREVVRRFVGEIKFQEVENPLLKYIANPIFNLYWKLARAIIWW